MIFTCLFFYTIGLMLFLPLVTSLKLAYFVPYIIFVIYRRDLLLTLLLACLSGLILDLFSAQTRFGLNALEYTLVSYFMYQFKNYFFEDSLSTTPLMTLFFVWTLALLQLLIGYLLGFSPLLSIEWFKIEMIKMPVINALYAFIFFLIPTLLFPRKTKKTISPIVFKGRI